MPKFNFKIGATGIAGKTGTNPSFGYTFQTPKAVVSTDASNMDAGARFTPTKPPLVAPKFSVDYSKLTASGKGSWNIELKTSFTDALNAGLAEGLGHIKTSIAGVGKMVAESKPTVKGIAVPPQPELAKKFDAAISSTESWIKQYEPESMTTFQALAKDLVSGGVSIFSSIGIGLLTGGAGSSAVLFGLMQAGDKYVEQRKAGVSAERAGGIATAQGFVEASLEFIGLDSFLKMRNGTVWNTLIRAGTEAVQEASQTFGENLLDTVWDKDQKLQEGVGRSALIGGLLGLPAAVSVSSYEQSSEYGQAVKRVAELGPQYAKRAEAIVQGIVRSVNEKVVPLVDETLQEARKSITLPDFQSVLGVQKTNPLKTTSGIGALVGQPQTVEGGTKPSPRFHLALAESNRQGVPVGEAVTKSPPPAPAPTRLALPAPSITQGVVAPSVQESDWGERSGTTGLRTTTHEVSYATKEGIQKKGILVEDSEGNLYGISKLEPTPISSPPVAISTQEASVPIPPVETAPPIAQETIVPKVPWEMTQAEWDAVQNPLDIKPTKPENRIVYHVLLKKGAGMTAEETIADALKNGIRRENTNTGIWVSLDKPVNDFGDMFVIELPASDLHIMNQQEAMVEKRDILPSDVRAYYPSFRATPNAEYTRLDTSKFENGDTRQDWVQVAQQNGITSSPVAESAPTVSKMETVGTEWDSPSGIRRVVGETTVNGEKRLVVQTGDQRIGQILLPADQLQSEMARDAKNLAFRKNEQEIANAPKAQPTYGEYVSSMPPMQRAKVSAALQKNIASNGVLQARSVLVEKWVAEGATVVQKADQRELTKPSGNYLLEKDLSKTAMDYAEWLINARSAPVSKMEIPPSTEQPSVVPAGKPAVGKRVTFSTMHGEEKGTEVSIPGVEKYRFAAVSGKEGVLRKSVGDSVARMRKETVYHVYELSSGMEAGHGGTKELAVQDVVDKMTAYAKEGESLDAVMKRSLTTPHPTTNTIAEVRNPQYVVSNLSTLPAGQTIESPADIIRSQPDPQSLFGSEVTVRGTKIGKHQDPDWQGTIQETVNGGDIVVVDRGGKAGSVRVKVEDIVSIDRLVVNDIKETAKPVTPELRKVRKSPMDFRTASEWADYTKREGAHSARDAWVIYSKALASGTPRAMFDMKDMIKAWERAHPMPDSELYTYEPITPSVTNTAPLPAGQTTSGQEVTPSYVSTEPNLATSGTSTTIPADNDTISRITVAFDQIEQHLGEKKSNVKAVEGTFQSAFAKFLHEAGIPKGALTWNQALDWYKASRGEKSFAKRVQMVKRAIEKYNLGIEQQQRTSIIAEISSLQAKSKSGVYAIAQEELDSLLGKYRKSRLSKKHKASLEASRAYFAEHPDLDLPSNLADEISLLDKETLKGMSVKELTALREKVKGILSSGKEAYREWKKRNELKQTLYKKSVLARAKSLGGATSENIGTVMTRWQKLYQDALAIDKTLEPTDVWMNQLGLMNEKKRFDDKYNHFLFVTRTIKSRVADLMAKNHLTMEDRQKIKLFQIVRMGREDLIAPIAEHLKMTVEQAGSITLTEGQKEVLDYMDSQYKAFFPIVQDYLARVKNQTIHQEDFYAPLLADPNALGNDTIESNAVTFYHNTKTISADSVRAREQLHYLTTSDAVSDFERYVTDMQYMIEMGELTKRLSEVVNSKEFQAKAGVLGQSILSDWLDTMARRGGASGEQRIRILDLLRKNTNTGYMTAKLGTVFVQFTAIADGFNEIGIKWMVAGAERQISPEWRSLMKDFAAEVYGNEADPDFTEPTWWKGLVKGLRTPVVAADAVVRRTVFLGAYARACERLGLAGTVEEFSSSDKEVKQNIREALAEAMQVTRKAQGTSEFKDQPLSISRGRIGNLIKNRSVGKLMTQFQSFNFFRFSNIKDTIWTSGIKRGRLDKALGGIFWLLLVASMSEVLLRRGARWISSGGKTTGEATDKITVGLKDTIEDVFGADPSWLTQLTAETFSGLVDNIPFMGQLVGMMMYGKDPLPVADAIIKFSQGVGSIVNGTTGTTKLRGVAGVVSAGGSLAGVPGSAQVGGTLRDVITTKKKPKFKFTLPY